MGCCRPPMLGDVAFGLGTLTLGSSPPPPPVSRSLIQVCTPNQLRGSCFIDPRR